MQHAPESMGAWGYILCTWAGGLCSLQGYGSSRPSAALGRGARQVKQCSPSWARMRTPVRHCTSGQHVAPEHTSMSYRHVLHVHHDVLCYAAAVHAPCCRCHVAGGIKGCDGSEALCVVADPLPNLDHDYRGHPRKVRAGNHTCHAVHTRRLHG